MGKQEISEREAPARQEGVGYADAVEKGGGSELYDDPDGLEEEEHKGAGEGVCGAEDGVAATGVEETGEGECKGELDDF